MKTACMSSLIAIAFLMVTCAVSQTPGVSPEVKVTRTTHPQKRLDWEVDVAAAIDQVWKCFSTRAGMISWITPDAQVDLRPGGKWWALYPGVAPGGGTILSYAPEQQITIHAMAPERFPTVRKEGTTAVFTFIALDDTHTRVHLSQVGWKAGDEWEKAYEHLAVGNAILLTQLRNRFIEGPANWGKTSAGEQAK